MATIKKVVGQITLKVLVDVASVTYFYLLMPSIAPAPSKPTTSPPTIYQTDGYSGWSTTEPGYTSGDTRSLYVTVRTIYSDGTFDYTTPSLSSSYEAAKEAYNRAQSAMSLAGDTNQYFWNIPSAYSTDVPAGVYVTSIPQNSFKPNPSGGNIVIQGTGLTIRNGTTQLASLTGQALNFYNPQATSGQNSLQLSIGANGVLQSGNFKYESGTYSESGTKIDLINGSIYTPGFRTDGSNTYIRGEVNALSGKIGDNGSNYWTIGNNYNYDQTASAALISHGTAFIQLDTSNTWRLSTDRIHTAWNGTDGSAALMFPKDGDTYWDWGIHSPHKTNGIWKDKFIYVRKYTNTNDDDFTNRDSLCNDLDDDLGYWTYQFYVDKNGSIYARNFYLLNADGTPGSNIGGQDAVYLLKSGGTITGNLEVNGTLTKGGKNVAYLTDTPTNGQILIADGTTGGIKTSGYTIATSVPQNAIFTDYRVRTDARNSTTMYLTGSNNTGTVSQGTLLTDSGVYIQTSNSTANLVVPKVNGYTLAAAAAKGVDTSMTSTSTSTNLPTTKAVADLIATYLPLAGGTISGAVDINDELYADGATFGNLIVNGVGRFTNGIYGDLIGSVTGNITGNASTADKVNHNLIIKLASGTTEGTNMFTFNGSVAKTVDITKSALGLGNVENKSSATIRGELTSANVTTALGFTPYNSTNPNGYTTNVGTITGVTAGTGLSGGGTSGTVTLNHSNSITAQTTQGIYPIKIDAQGHISAYGSAPTTLSGYGITDAKIANGVITLGSNTITPLTSQWTANLYVGKTATDKANAAATNGNVYLNLVENNTVRNAHNLVGANGLTITTADTSGTITFTSPSAFTDVQAVNIGTETNPQYVLRFTKSGGGTVDVSTANIAVVQSEGANRLVSTNEPNGLTVAGPVKFSNGVPVTMKPNSSAGQFLKDDGTWATPTNTNTTYTLTNALSSHKFTWTLTAGGSGSGSTTTALELVQGNNITLTDDTANKKVTIAATDTKYSAGNGLRLNGTQFINIRIPFVAGTQTAQTGSWTGVCNDITALYDGLTIAYWLPRAGSGNATLNLTINGNETGAKNCYYGGTSRLTTHFGAGNIIYLTYQSAANINGTTYEGWWANANYDSNDTGYYHRRIYPNMKAGSNKIYPYTLIMQLPDGRWESLVTSNSTGTSKARNTHGFLLGHILLMYYNETYTENQNLSTYRIWSAHTGLIDHRYSFNTANDATNGTIGYKPIYLVGSLGSDGLFYLAEKWWTQTLPTTADGKIYIYIGDAYDYYRMTFTEDKPMYIYTNGKLREFSQDAATVAGYTVAKDVPSNAVFTDTWKALSTSQAGYVAQAPNDTGKFLRGDATWTAVTKSNVGLGNVDNTADANKRVKGANITTTANAVAKYSDTNGTFADSTTTFDGNNLVIGSTDNPGNLKIGAKNDNYGLMPNTSNYNQIGSSSLYWYRSYITHYYGTQSHITNWDAGKNIGTAVTSGAASTLGSVNFYNTCAAGGTQTKTLLTADSTASSNVTITLPKTTGTLALTSEIPTNYVTLNTVQNITANKIFSAGIKWTAESGTNPSKFGACSYNSTLEALVFSFS